jgi:hypothetical protein
VRAPGVVPLDPLGNGGASFGEAAEVMQPDTLPFETTKEPFNADPKDAKALMEQL